MRVPVRRLTGILSRTHSEVWTNNCSLSKWQIQSAPVEQASQNTLKESSRKLLKRPLNAIQILKKLEEDVFVSSVEALNAIQSCKHLNLIEGKNCVETVQKLWNSLVAAGVKLDITHYYALLRVYTLNEHPFNPEEILEDMMRNNIEPNHAIFQCVIMAYAYAGNIEKTMNVLSGMKEKDFPIIDNTYSALIRVHAENDDMKKAEEILEIATSDLPNSCIPSVMCTIICEYLKRKDIKKALHFLDLTKTVRSFSTDNYFMILHHLALHEYKDEFDHVLERMVKPSDYNAKAPHFIIALVQANKTYFAFELLKEMNVYHSPCGNKVPLGKFYVRALIDNNMDATTIVNQCCEMMAIEVLDNALSFAMGLCLQYEKYDLALDLFRVAKKKDIPVRVHYFWPLLSDRGRNKDAEGLLRILTVVQREFNLTLDDESVRDYVIPYLLNENTDIDELILKLKNFEISIRNLAHGIIITLLCRNKFKKAAYVAEKYPSVYPMFLFRKPIARNFVMTKDYDSFIKLLKAVYNGAVFRETNAERFIDGRPYDKDNCVGGILSLTVTELLQDDANLPVIETLLLKLLDSKLPIAKIYINELRKLLCSKADENTFNLLNKLESSEFTGAEVLNSENSNIQVTSLDEKTMEQLCESMEDNGECTLELKKQLFVLYGRNKNLEKLLKIKKDLESNGELSNGMYAYLISTLTKSGNWKDALQICKEQYEKNENFGLDVVKLLSLALTLIKNSENEEAFNLLTKKTVECNRGDSVMDEASHLCRHILNHFADANDVENIDRAYELIVAQGLVPVNGKMLGPMISIYLQRNDLESALNRYREFVFKYKCTPWIYSLGSYIVSHGDEENLKTFINLSCLVHDEGNMIYDLIVINIQLNKLEEAKKLLQHPVLKTNVKGKQRLYRNYAQFCTDKDVQALRNLIVVTEESNLFDRYDLYSNALLACDYKNDVESTKMLWTQMQEEGISSTVLLNQIGRILKRHDIPFNFPVTEDDAMEPEPVVEYNFSAKKLNNLIYSGKLDEALKVGKKSLTRSNYSILVKACLHANKYPIAKELTQQYYKKTRVPIQFDEMKYLLSHAAKNADVEFIEFLGKIIPEDLKNRTSFYNAAAMSYLNANKSEEYIEKLENSLKMLNEKAEFNNFLQSIPSGALITMMLINPQHLHRTIAVLEGCINKGDHTVSPSILWNYYMLKKQFGEADQIWEKYLQNNEDNITFKRICKQITNNVDTALGEKLIQCLESKESISEGALGIGYGVLIMAYVKLNRIQEALELVERALKRIPIAKIIVSSLFSLQASCVVKQIPFPYRLPSSEPLKQIEFMHSSEKMKENLEDVYNLF